MPSQLLFICTGNYYRSRFAEALFNHLATREGLGWRAFSRGLQVADAPEQPPYSPFTREGLISRGVPLELVAPRKQALTEPDLKRADRIVALKEAEHRPMMRQAFPAWEAHLEYWGVHDLDASGPLEALALIEEHVGALAAELGRTPR
jgi:protein-tyrosine phosphatase